MDDLTRRTALSLVAAGTAVTSLGVATAGEEKPPEEKPPTDRRPEDVPPAAIPDDLYVASLEPQAGVETDAMGSAAFQFRNGQVTFVLSVLGVEDTFMTHIHEGEPLGPIAVWLHDFEQQDEELISGSFSGLLDAGTITDDAIAAGRADDAETNSVADLQALVDAGEAFVNLHTEQFPDGELAGQIVPFNGEMAAMGPP